MTIGVHHAIVARDKAFAVDDSAAAPGVIKITIPVDAAIDHRYADVAAVIRKPSIALTDSRNRHPAIVSGSAEFRAADLVIECDVFHVGIVGQGADLTRLYGKNRRANQ